MIKKILEISQSKTRLSVRNSQLVVEGPEGERAIPCEDVGLLVVDHPGTVYTHGVFTALVEAGAAVVLCGRDHLPGGMFLPVSGHSVQTQRWAEQLAAKEPVKKQMWRQLVQAKIRHQAKVLGYESETGKQLLEMAKEVRSGDAGNLESQASRKYWPAYLSGVNFRRRRDGAAPNGMLNYGYTVVRSAIARALCGAGLLVSLGVHHRNKYNAFCLADDVLEPFRGYVDAAVLEIWEEKSEEEEEVTQEVKARLLSVLYQSVTIGGFTGPLMVGLHRTAASAVRCFTGEQKEMDLPEL